MSQEHPLDNSVLRPKAAAAFLCIGQSTLWRWAAEGKLPKGIRLSKRATVWRRSDLARFIEQAAEGLR